MKLPQFRKKKTLDKVSEGELKILLAELEHHPLVARGRAMHAPTKLCDICYFNCRGDHNVFKENLRLAKGSPAGVRKTPLRV